MFGFYVVGELFGLGVISGKVFCSGMVIIFVFSFGRILGCNLVW